MAGDQYWSNTTLVVQAEGANNATSIFNKVNAQAATVAGNAKLSTAQKKYGYSSLLLDGTGDYITFPDSEAWNFGAGDFTIECWYRPATVTGASQWRGLVSQRNTSGTNHAFCLFVNQNNSGFGFSFSTDGAASNEVTFGGALTVGQWYHVAVSRVGATLYCSVDGVVESKTGTSSAFFNSTQTLSIGRLDASPTGGYINGYMDDIRITKGVARYTSNFTPAPIEVGEITPANDPQYTNVRLLLNLDGAHLGTTFTDQSNYGFTVNRASTTALSGVLSKAGDTSCYFNGSSEYLYVADQLYLRPYTSDFCIEAWVYITASTLINVVFSKGASTGVDESFLGITAFTRKLYFSTDVTIAQSSGAIALNTWTHVAAVRESGTLKLYINGIQDGSGSLPNDLSSTGELRIGRGRRNSANYFTGYLDCFRYTIGNARYTANFTPPNYVLPATGYENLTLSGVVDVDVYDDYLIAGAINVTVADDIYAVAGVIDAEVFANFSLIGGLDIDIVDAVYHLDAQIQVETFAVHSVAGVVNVAIIDPVQLSADISVDMYSSNRRLAGGIFVNMHETISLTGVLVIDIAHVTYQAVGSISVNIHETFQLDGNVRVGIYPGFTDGVGGQNQGSVVVVPEDRRIKWTVRVTLGGEDVSSRLTGTVSVDAEENSASVAVFKLRPGDGLVDVYSWTNNPVEIYYRDKTSGAEFLMFRGAADTPVFDASLGLVEFTCTDNQQKIINALGRSAIDALTPNAKWSKYVFDELANIQQYLDDRCSTYPYAYNISLNGNLQVYDYSVGSIKWEFRESAIVHGSLAPTLANTNSLVNYIEVKTNIQEEQFRETVISARWRDHQFVEQFYFPNWWLCQAQMIMDAIGGTDAYFVVDPLIGIIPPTSYRGKNGARWAHINPGDGLIAVEFMGSFSKRYLQNSNTTRSVIVRDPVSISQSGVRESTVETSLAVEYNEGITEIFTTPKDKSKYLCSAGNGGLQQPSDAIQPQPEDPLLVSVDGGWKPYPRMPISYRAWDETDTQLEDIHQYRWRMLGDGQLEQENVLFSTPGNVPAGEYLYLMDDFIIAGHPADQATAHETAVAVAKMQIRNSHRANQVSFSTLIFPHVHRGDRIRVNTNRVKATGVVRQYTHLFDVERGTALTNLYLAVSSSKAVGLGTGIFSNLRLSGVVSVAIVGPGTSTSLPVTQADVNYNPSLLTYYTGNALDSYTFDGEHWGGFFTRVSVNGDLQFAVEFPAIAEDNVANIDVLDYQGEEDAEVPNDELILIL